MLKKLFNKKLKAVPIYNGPHNVVSNLWSYGDSMTSSDHSPDEETSQLTTAMTVGTFRPLRNVQLADGPPEYSCNNAAQLQGGDDVWISAPLASPDVSMLSSSSESSCLHSVDTTASNNGLVMTGGRTDEDDFLSSVLNAGKLHASPDHLYPASPDHSFLNGNGSAVVASLQSRDYQLASRIELTPNCDNWLGSSSTLVGSMIEAEIRAEGMGGAGCREMGSREEAAEETGINNTIVTVAELAKELLAEDETEDRFITPTNSPMHAARQRNAHDDFEMKHMSSVQSSASTFSETLRSKVSDQFIDHVDIIDLTTYERLPHDNGSDLVDFSLPELASPPVEFKEIAMLNQDTSIFGDNLSGQNINNYDKATRESKPVEVNSDGKKYSVSRIDDNQPWKASIGSPHTASRKTNELTGSPLDKPSSSQASQAIDLDVETENDANFKRKNCDTRIKETENAGWPGNRREESESGIDSETDSVSSEINTSFGTSNRGTLQRGNCWRNSMDDVDVFIARMTVPPPPTSSPTLPDLAPFHTDSPSTDWNESSEINCNVAAPFQPYEDLFELAIPPPDNLTTVNFTNNLPSIETKSALKSASCVTRQISAKNQSGVNQAGYREETHSESHTLSGVFTARTAASPNSCTRTPDEGKKTAHTMTYKERSHSCLTPTQLMQEDSHDQNIDRTQVQRESSRDQNIDRAQLQREGSRDQSTDRMNCSKKNDYVNVKKMKIPPPPPPKSTLTNSASNGMRNKDAPTFENDFSNSNAIRGMNEPINCSSTIQTALIFQPTTQTSLNIQPTASISVQPTNHTSSDNATGESVKSVASKLEGVLRFEPKSIPLQKAKQSQSNSSTTVAAPKPAYATLGRSTTSSSRNIDAKIAIKSTVPNVDLISSNVSTNSSTLQDVPSSEIPLSNASISDVLNSVVNNSNNVHLSATPTISRSIATIRSTPSCTSTFRPPNVSSPILSRHASTEPPSVQSPKSVSISKVITRIYAGERILADVQHDLNLLVTCLQSVLPASYTDDVGTGVRQQREQLMIEAKTFVSDCKSLVSSATQSESKLNECVTCSMHTLARIVSQYRLSLNSATTAHLANTLYLSSKLTDVISAYNLTVQRAYVAVGKSLADTTMKQLMSQATLLAGALSTLMKILKAYETQ